MVQSACQQGKAHRFGKASKISGYDKMTFFGHYEPKSSAKSICFNIPTCRLHHLLDLEQQFNLPTDFLSFSISEVPKFFDQSSQNGEKVHFLAPASRVSKKFCGSYRAKTLSNSVRALCQKRFVCFDCVSKKCHMLQMTFQRTEV